MNAGAVVGFGRGELDADLAAFARDVGPDGPVCVVGGRTQWDVGGLPAPGCREVTAPAGVVSHQPEEMVVRVRAGTTVAALDAAVASAGQMVVLDPAAADRATVGGVLAVGRSGVRRLRYGPIRDSVLEVRFVSAEGRLVKAGGPVVKNVTGYDLCKLLVGSLGTLGLLAEVVLRCYPVPAAHTWFAAVEADPFDLYRRLFRPSAVLWDGRSVWVLLEGHPADVADQAAGTLGPAFTEAAGPPPLPSGPRLSVPPGELARSAAALPVGWIAEVGVGTVHTAGPAAGTDEAPRLDGGPPDRRTGELHAAVKARFDPTGRLNPGRTVL